MPFWRSWVNIPYQMIATPLTRTLARLLAFSTLWIAILAARSIRGGNPRALLYCAIFAAFLLPTIGVLLVAQRLARYRIPWPIEFLSLPFVAGAMIYVAAAIRS